MSVQQRWQALLPRERLVLRVAAWLGALALLWWVGLQPALRMRQQADDALPRLQSQLQTMRTLQQQATQAQQLKPLEFGQAQALFAQACRAHGIPETPLNRDGPSTVVLQGLAPEVLGRWLVQVRTTAHVLPVQAQLRRDAQGLWSGTVRVQGH